MYRVLSDAKCGHESYVVFYFLYDNNIRIISADLGVLECQGAEAR